MRRVPFQFPPTQTALPENGVLSATVSGQEMDRAPIRMLFADDDARYRTLIQAVVRTYPRFELVGAACDGEEAVALARQLQPEVALLDVEMPTMDGMTAAALIAEELPTTLVLLQTGDRVDEHSPEAHALGLQLLDKLSIHSTLSWLDEQFP
jgi:chemotaxis response regulator CheB